jgi:pilus assembly protein CpaC
MVDLIKGKYMNLLNKFFSLAVLIMIAAIPFKEAFAASKKQHSSSQNKSYDNMHSFSQALNNILPKENIEISVIKNSVLLTGAISNVEVADKAEKMAKEYFGQNYKILNFLKIKGSQQVMLRVRVGEVKRDVLKNYNTTTADFDYLEQAGLIRTVAEPNLVALSGEKAEFLAGGEFPVPTAQKEGNVTIDYKSYGVKVGFTPLVIASNRIRLNIEQELSEINKEASVMANGFNIPSVITRRAKTTIELAPGESFMIAGLIKEDYKGNRGKETELVVSVTPYLVNPMHSKDLRIPSDNVHSSTILEKNFINKISKNNSNQGQLNGPSGFIAE